MTHFSHELWRLTLRAEHVFLFRLITGTELPSDYQCALITSCAPCVVKEGIVFDQHDVSEITDTLVCAACPLFFECLSKIGRNLAKTVKVRTKLKPDDEVSAWLFPFEPGVKTAIGQKALWCE